MMAIKYRTILAVTEHSVIIILLYFMYLKSITLDTSQKYGMKLPIVRKTVHSLLYSCIIPKSPNLNIL